MSRKQTQFIVLPNEVIYYIFDYLTSADILRAFSQLNHRYANLVRFYVKHIDLTDGWQGNQHDLQWISKTIETLKLNRLYLHLLNDPSAWESVLSIPMEENPSQQDKKFLFRSVMKKILMPFQKTTTSPQTCVYEDTAVARYRFPRLGSLHLVNVYYWNNIVSNMNLDSLNISFDGGMRYYSSPTQIPQTVTRFSSNISLNPYSFHKNIIDMNVCVFSIDQLIRIAEQTPNVQYMSVSFAENFNDQYCVDDLNSCRVDAMIINFRPLSSLSRLSFATKHDKRSKSNERLPFDQIQLFIDRCCPDKTILKHVALKLDHIIFRTDMWFTIMRYKDTFDRFDFYASLIVEKKASNRIEIPLSNDHFEFHIEDGDAAHSEHCFVHIYSLPFGFDKLHGFISCSELSHQCSFSNVRHLYFTETHLNRLISFKSLAKRMPHLTSINCNFSFIRRYNIDVSIISGDGDIFNNVRSLHFISHCKHTDCLCHNLLPQLLNEMPYLQSLTTSVDGFIHGQRPLPPIKRLNLQECHFKLFDTLAERLPFLSTILLDDMPISIGQLSQLLSSLFIGISALKIVFFRGPIIDWDDLTPYTQVANKAIAQVQKMDNRLRHLKLDVEAGMPTFYLQDL